MNIPIQKLTAMKKAVREMAGAVQLAHSGYYGHLPEGLLRLLSAKSNDLVIAAAHLEDAPSTAHSPDPGAAAL